MEKDKIRGKKFPAKITFEVRCILEVLDDNTAIAFCKTKHPTIGLARQAAQDDEIIVQVTRQVVQ